MKSKSDIEMARKLLKKREESECKKNFRTNPKYKCTKPVPCGFNPSMPTVSSRGREQATRKSEKERMRDYRRELEEREEKLKNRPLLFERVAQKNARMAAEKHYSNTLKELGISDEFVSEKGQSGNIFEYFSNQKMKSFTEDKESFNEEEKIEEREDGEENYLTDTNSQDSCKVTGEGDEGSGEENSSGVRSCTCGVKDIYGNPSDTRRSLEQSPHVARKGRIQLMGDFVALSESMYTLTFSECCHVALRVAILRPAEPSIAVGEKALQRSLAKAYGGPEAGGQKPHRSSIGNPGEEGKAGL
ncbi:hypothetical protein E2I00_015684 [Balaenoptera physalus]|uniref:FAM161 centrosomal protein A n=1 Tax=Balaenoptera physalus TaxID=9770 RepID=A0A643C698_BALPH|nr:hypothetical protein E2I00_015684 [Balaenoptera physalus]